MSSSAQYQFAAEFITFLACAAGLAVVVLRSELVVKTRWAQSFFTFGFLLLGTASFMHGALIDTADALVFTIRGIGVVALAAGALDWQGPVFGRRLLVLGLALVGVSLAVAAADRGSLADLALGLGAIGIGASVYTVSRRSIAARVAASAALVLLLVVLVLSLALSTVISNTVRDEAQRRLSERATVEATLIENRRDDAIRGARLAAVSLQSGAAPELLKLYTTPQHSALIDDALRKLSENFLDGLPLAYLSFDRAVLAAYKLEARELSSLAGSDAVIEAARRQSEVGTPAIINHAVAIGVSPVAYQPTPTDTRLPLGLVVATYVLDDSYLNFRSRDNAGLSLAIANRTLHTVARFGRQPNASATDALVRRVLNEAQPATTTSHGRFIAAHPVMASDGTPVMALVAATPTTVVDTTRHDLYRTLFFIALGGTLLALLLAALVGERIGAGVRRLTTVAGAISRGDLSVRAEVLSEDEVGVLGAAFDSMAASIEEKTTALRDAADDEARLRDRLEAVVAGMGEALVAVDAEGRITQFNQAAEELTGFSAAEARGKDAARLLPLRTEAGIELGPRLRKPLIRRWTAVANLQQRDAPVPVAVTAGALRGPGGELAGGVFVLRDLRGEREVERMKTEFLSHIGHELRTPLAGVIGFTEILTRRELTPTKAREVQQDILTSAHQLARIVEMLEFFATTSAGRSPLRPDRLDLRAMVDDVVDRWSTRVNGTHPINRRVARGLPPLVGDKRWITKSIDELVDNAVKFSPEGGRITITVEPSVNGRSNGVEISVTDQGVGMTEDEHDRAFSDFVQGDGSDTRPYGGLGLGLAMVKRVAEAHGGHVDVESAPKKGAKFSIFLPAATNLPKQGRR